MPCEPATGDSLCRASQPCEPATGGSLCRASQLCEPAARCLHDLPGSAARSRALRCTKNQRSERFVLVLRVSQPGGFILIVRAAQLTVACSRFQIPLPEGGWGLTRPIDPSSIQDWSRERSFVLEATIDVLGGDWSQRNFAGMWPFRCCLRPNNGRRQPRLSALDTDFNPPHTRTRQRAAAKRT